MFLKSIILRNFKCLADIELSFDAGAGVNRKWTIILGENGTGKSNLLKAIALVTAGSNAIGELIGDVDSWIRIGQTSCSVTAVLETKKGEQRRIELVLNRGEQLRTISANNSEALQLIDEAIDHASRNYFVVAYGADRRMSRETFSGRPSSEQNSRTAKVKSLFDPNISLNPLTSWVIQLDYVRGKAGLDIVRSALNDFLPGTTFHSIDRPKQQVIFQTVDGLVPLDQLSDGYQNMAAWVGDLLFRVTSTFEDYKRPLEARGLLLIDEIDVHLHPKWQRKLYDFISTKLPNLQVIATTHSPLTAQQAGEGELFALRRDDNSKVELLPFVGAPNKLLVNQLLMTPVFGLETDESYAVEQTKSRYEVLKGKGAELTPREHKEMTKVQRQLKQDMPKRPWTSVSENEIALLTKIEQQLDIK
jgi:predicted ATPase